MISSTASSFLIGGTPAQVQTSTGTTGTSNVPSGVLVTRTIHHQHQPTGGVTISHPHPRGELAQRGAPRPLPRPGA